MRVAIFLLPLMVGCQNTPLVVGCRDSVTLLSPSSDPTKQPRAECEVNQHATNQIASNNSVVVTCTCAREAAAEKPAIDAGAE